MAKKVTFADFDADDSYVDEVEDTTSEDTSSEVEDQEDEDQEDESVKPPKKKAVKKEDQEPVNKGKVKKTKTAPDPIDEDDQDIEEDDNVDDTIIDQDKSEEDEDNDDGIDPTEFFEEVHKLTGQDVKVDYGDIDPLTPQGIALREKAVREDALDSFLTEIEQKFPQAFKALQHSYNGGDISELFSQTTTRDYSKVELKDKGDETLAKEILKEYYKSKGVKNESKIAKWIESDEESEIGLIGEAKSALEELRTEQEEQRNKVLEGQKQKAAEQKKRDDLLVAAVDDVLDSRKLGTFMIQDRVEANEFKKFVLSNIRKTKDDKYELATPLDQNNMEKILQYQYFQFKKGDLGKVVMQKAATENTKKLKLRLKSEQSRPKKGTETVSSKYSMSDFEAD